MGKTINMISMVFLLLAVLVFNVPFSVSAADSFTKVESGFTLDSKQSGINIARGSTIVHQIDGITSVYGVDKSLVLKALDAESGIVLTPCGYRNASDIYSLPSGAIINYGSRVTQIFDRNDELILTVIYERQKRQIRNEVVPGTQGWLAQTFETGLTIDYFTAYWGVPNPPPNNDDVAFYWNGIQNPTGDTLLQPVLQWNQSGYADQWSVQAWALWPNGGLSKGGVTVVDYGDTIGGRLEKNGNYWYVIVNVNGGNWDGIIISTNILGTTSITVLNVLEVARPDWNPFEDDDLPGSGYFFNETFQYNSNRVYVYWEESILDPNLNLNVYFDSSSYASWVYFATPN